MGRRIKLDKEFVILVSVILLLFLTACGPPLNQAVPASSDNEVGVKFPAPPPREIVNVNLDSALNQLIIAERHGQAESFARQADIKLVDGTVLVTIEAVPGQVEVASKAAANVGAQHLQTGSIGSTKDWIDAVVPITSLEALAN